MKASLSFGPDLGENLASLFLPEWEQAPLDQPPSSPFISAVAAHLPALNYLSPPSSFRTPTKKSLASRAISTASRLKLLSPQARTPGIPVSPSFLIGWCCKKHAEMIEVLKAFMFGKKEQVNLISWGDPAFSGKKAGKRDQNLLASPGNGEVLPSDGITSNAMCEVLRVLRQPLQTLIEKGFLIASPSKTTNQDFLSSPVAEHSLRGVLEVKTEKRNLFSASPSAVEGVSVDDLLATPVKGQGSQVAATAFLSDQEVDLLASLPASPHATQHLPISLISRVAASDLLKSPLAFTVPSAPGLLATPQMETATVNYSSPTHNFFAAPLRTQHCKDQFQVDPIQTNDNFIAVKKQLERELSESAYIEVLNDLFNAVYGHNRPSCYLNKACSANLKY